MPGIDSVTNASATKKGIDAESIRCRIQDPFCRFYREPLSCDAVVDWLCSEQYSARPFVPFRKTLIRLDEHPLGSFVVTVDDGTGTPSTVLLSAIQSAIDVVRPVGSSFCVQAPTIVSAGLSMNIVVVAGTAKAPVQALVGNALLSYVNNLSIGDCLPLTKLAQIAYEASSSIAVVNVSQVLINGNENDLVPGMTGVVKTGTVAVN